MSSPGGPFGWSFINLKAFNQNIFWRTHTSEVFPMATTTIGGAFHWHCLDVFEVFIFLRWLRSRPLQNMVGSGQPNSLGCPGCWSERSEGRDVFWCFGGLDDALFNNRFLQKRETFSNHRKFSDVYGTEEDFSWSTVWSDSSKRDHFWVKLSKFQTSSWGKCSWSLGCIFPSWTNSSTSFERTDCFSTWYVGNPLLFCKKSPQMLFDLQPEPMYGSLLYRFTSSSKSTKKGFPEKMAESRVQTPASLVGQLEAEVLWSHLSLTRATTRSSCSHEGSTSISIDHTNRGSYLQDSGWGSGVYKRHHDMMGWWGGREGWWGGWWWWWWCCSVRKLGQLQKPVVNHADISFQSLLQKKTAWLICHPQSWTCLFSLFKPNSFFLNKHTHTQISFGRGTNVVGGFVS